MARAPYVGSYFNPTYKYRGIRIGVGTTNSVALIGRFLSPKERWVILFQELFTTSPREMSVSELTEWADLNYRNEDGIPWRLTFLDADLVFPFDDLPWEIHDIDDPQMREIATDVYKANRIR